MDREGELGKTLHASSDLDGDGLTDVAVSALGTVDGPRDQGVAFLPYGAL